MTYEFYVRQLPRDVIPPSDSIDHDDIYDKYL
jgi:hypothetical protein